MTLAMVAMWVFIGLLVGLVAGPIMKAGGYGRRWDVLLALVGSVVGSGIAWLLEIPSHPGPGRGDLRRGRRRGGPDRRPAEDLAHHRSGGQGTLDGVGHDGHGHRGFRPADVNPLLR
jgi:uncharacterized membrane protein YeaQ/YmgE (transglycosylase-associated protein family)